MNKHLRLVVSALFIVIILLAIGITQFYSNTEKSTSEGINSYEIINRLNSDNNGNRIFKDSNNLYGIIDSNDKVIVAPEWLELNFTKSNAYCIASMRINDRLLTGCIDYEGNVIIPFIYRNITPHTYGNFTFYTADADNDISYVLYDEQFVPIFSRSWDDCILKNDILTLASNLGTYSYSVTNSGLTLDSATINENTLDCKYTLNIGSDSMLANLTPTLLEKIGYTVSRYIEFAFTGSGEYLNNIKTVDRPSFTQLFPDDKKILSKKLIEISRIYIYIINSDDDMPHYAVSIIADTEISYSDDNGTAGTLIDEYRAVVEFCGTSENDFAVISGKFVLDEPIYPKINSEQ